MFEVATEIALFLICAAFLAGLIDSIAGGGGLITVPAMLLAGASPLQTVATNKLQGTFGAGMAAFAYARAGHVNPKTQWKMALISGLAGAGGATITNLVPAEVLRIVMPIILVAIALFFALRKGLSDEDRVERVTPAVFALTFVPLIGAYDGFFGPGTGSFFMLGFVLLAGYGILKATAHTKILNFSSNIGALLVFIPSGQIWWAIGLAMACAQMAGAFIGTKIAMRVGSKVIRPLLVVTSSAMALRLIYQAYSG